MVCYKNLGIASHINKKKQKKWLVEKKGLPPAVAGNLLAKWEQSENLSLWMLLDW
jgi:hypothetical protein